MSPEETALALVRATLEAPGTVTDTVLIQAVLASDDPQQHHLDTTKSLMRITAALLDLMAMHRTDQALLLLAGIEAAYKIEGTN